MSDSKPPESEPLAISLRSTLKGLIQDPYPHVANPEGCKKRASVALILRIRSHFNHRPAQEEHEEGTLSAAEAVDRFFDRSWVQHGDPEVVFIKRAARAGDRWTSHVALPGGKRDPEDEDDKAVAIRETSEEIGLDLTSPHALFVGNLPERVVSTSWGKAPLMVLCPFVFLWTQPELPPLKLQPAEIASTHWVPLRVLLAPQSRTFEYVDVSDRFARQGGTVLKTAMRWVLGKMRFSAIKLVPSESLYCSTTAEFFPAESDSKSNTNLGRMFYTWYLGDHAGSSDRARPLLLWGLTLGMLADFLDQLPPHNAVQLWSYPTFTSLDVRWIINMLTRSLKRRNHGRLQGGNQTAIDSQTEAVSTGGSGDNPWFIGGLSDGMKRTGKGINATKSYAVGVMLDGYYDAARRGVWIAASLRLIGTIAFISYIIKRFRRSNSDHSFKMTSIRYRTAIRFIEAFDKLSVETFLALQTPACEHVFAPASLSLPPKNNETFSAHITGLQALLESFPVIPIEVQENPDKNQVLIWATSQANFHHDLKDSGISDEQWTYKGEYMYLLSMDGSGEKIDRVVEFLDSQGTERLHGLLARAKHNKEMIEQMN
ncbi:Uncharacterized protein LSUE1_G000871 [Lachnellula suecica]|uniref:Nudix hydrolase domain-containing protein n=1 Tax=Lachnellula suecica TaxID=602035 RepID=A0A8T9CGG7_9HELO|nr:Uncharacterized protein LSUE1_G000871 [Lachnellula suecica]